MNATKKFQSICGFFTALVFYWSGSVAVQAADAEYSMVRGFGGVPLAVFQTGNRAGLPILFIHGSSQSMRVWSKQFVDPDLTEDFHLIAFDLRGHGASGKPWHSQAYGEEPLAGDVKAVIDTFTSLKVALVPWSYGGNVAMAYVRKFGLDRVSGINIVASRSGLGPSTMLSKLTEAERDVLNIRRRSMRSDDIAVNAEATRSFIRDLSAAKLDEEAFREFLAFNMMTAPYVRRAKGLYRPDNRDLASHMTVPVLVSHGDADALVSIEDAHRTRSMIKGSRISIYEGAGHMPFYENSERFNHELSAFVSMLQSQD